MLIRICLYQCCLRRCDGSIVGFITGVSRDGDLFRWSLPARTRRLGARHSWGYHIARQQGQIAAYTQYGHDSQIGADGGAGLPASIAASVERAMPTRKACFQHAEVARLAQPAQAVSEMEQELTLKKG